MNYLKYITRYLKKIFTIIICQVNTISQLHLASELKMYTWGEDSFGTKLKKNSRQDIFFKNVVPKESFFFVASYVVPILYNKPCILENNVFGRDGIIQISIIFSKDINTQCLCEVYCRELGQYLTQFDALEIECNETTNYSI